MKKLAIGNAVFFTLVAALFLYAQQPVNHAQVAGAATATAASGVQLVGIEGRAGTSLETTAGVIDENLKNIGNSAVTTTDNGTQAVAPIVTTSSTAATSACNILSAASTNSTSCKGSAGNFYGFEVFNTSTTVYYLRLYNSSSAPTCSSATGFIRTIPVPPAAAAGGVGGAISNQVFPVNYGTGIGYCITGGSSSTDNTNAATGVFGEIRYK